MSGITGSFHFATDAPINPQVIERMNRAMVHRGPDDEGYFHAPRASLAMRRLSIIDRAGGHQPIANEDQTIWVVFNGEIYNHHELRRKLDLLGHQFQTRSDTEVIVHLYEEYGPDYVHHLDGMFAIALYDGRNPRKPRVLLSRDRVGKKPLFWAIRNGALLFGSEIHVLLQHPSIQPNIDAQAVHHFLSLLYIPAPLSILSGVAKLPPGHTLECDETGVHLRRYWDPQDYLNCVHDSPEVIRSTVRDLLYQAVERRLEAQVPLGAFLSGGLDSATVVAIMAELRHDPIRTFSVGFAGQRSHNELSAAERLAAHCGTEHESILVEPSILEQLPEFIRFADEPLAIPSALPIFTLAQAARREVTVVLTGDGGNEVFGGYDHYLFERWANLYRQAPAGIGRVATAAAARLGSDTAHRTFRFVGNARHSIGERRLGWSDGFDEQEKSRLLVAPTAHLQTSSSFLEGMLTQATRHMNGEVQANALDVVVWLPDEMLVKVDRMTMASSIEARSPLLDRRLVEYGLGLPFDSKIPRWSRDGLKNVLRDAAQHLLPPELLLRRKWGFNMPLHAWLSDGLASFLRSTLSRQRLDRTGIFRHDVVSSLLEEAVVGRRNVSNRLFAVLVLQLWTESVAGG